MHQAIAPIAVRPWTLNGLSERLLVSHYEHHYGSAVRTVERRPERARHARCRASDYQLGALKREELAAMGSWRFTSCISATWAGKGTRSRIRSRPPSRALRECPGLAPRVRAAGQSLAHGSGWVALTYSRRARQFWNQTAADHSQAAVDAAPVLVLECMSTRTPWTSARTPRRTSTPSCGTSTGRR